MQPTPPPYEGVASIAEQVRMLQIAGSLLPVVSALHATDQATPAQCVQRGTPTQFSCSRSANVYPVSTLVSSSSQSPCRHGHHSASHSVRRSCPYCPSHRAITPASPSSSAVRCAPRPCLHDALWSATYLTACSDAAFMHASHSCIPLFMLDRTQGLKYVCHSKCLGRTSFDQHHAL